jgi:hypothetical protein
MNWDGESIRYMNASQVGGQVAGAWEVDLSGLSFVHGTVLRGMCSADVHAIRAPPFKPRTTSITWVKVEST